MPAYPLPAKDAAAYAYEAFKLATFTVAAEAADEILVTVQLKDANGRVLYAPAHCQLYLASNSTGTALTGTALTSIAIGAFGTLLATLVTGKMYDVLSDNTGKFSLTLGQSGGAATYYMVLKLPDGNILVSSAITFAA